MGSIFVDLGGRTVELAVRRSARARRMALKADPALGSVVLVLPERASLTEGRRFAEAHAAWIGLRLARPSESVPFSPGNCLPLLGVPHRLEHRPGARRGVWVEAGVILVSGDPQAFARRVEDFLRAEAKRTIVPRALLMARRLGSEPGRVSVRDTISRWGSCSARGDLSFSWRLVMAPEWVLDYVVAHEVAHLAEHNHGPRFRAQLDALFPDVARAESWLKREGAGLHGFGRMC